MTRLSVFFCVVFGTVSLIQGVVREEFLFPVAADLSGDFPVNPGDGSVCRWYEQRGNTGKGPRGFLIRCTYECRYKGNPHNCNWYNHGNQAMFYRGLSIEAATNQENACSQASLVYDECPNTEFKKEPAQFFLGSF